jgi:DNA mismatch endonuclease, patch repair protein
MKKRVANYQGRNFKKIRSPDQLSVKARSGLMSKIRSTNTKFEADFVKLLRQQSDFSFSTHRLDLFGKPDIVFSEQKICVFLDSDFWHGWQYSRWKHLLKNDFWREKIAKNRRRDLLVTCRLRRAGWKVIRIWEHSIKKDQVTQIKRILNLAIRENDPGLKRVRP